MSFSSITGPDTSGQMNTARVTSEGALLTSASAGGEALTDTVTTTPLGIGASFTSDWVNVASFGKARLTAVFGYLRRAT